MVSTVFVLGAGASAESGVPLMSQFLDAAHDLMTQNTTDADAAAFKEVFEALAVLPRAHSKAVLDVDNVESAFSAFEMARVIRVFGDWDARRIDALELAMRQVIAKTIERTLQLPVRDDAVHAPKPYEEFADLVARLQKQPYAHDVTVITFNYDLACDFAFTQASLVPLYRINDSEPTSGTPLLKLHGSVNWGVCEVCKQIVPWRLHDYFKTHAWRNLDLVKSARLTLYSNMHTFSHCEKVVSGPTLVPPTWGKTSQHLNLWRVWHSAARALQMAENIFVIGYSLPESDAFFKYLYALGTIGAARIRRFWVVNPDPQVGNRFKALLGQSVLPRFQNFQETFATGLRNMFENVFPTRAA